MTEPTDRIAGLSSEKQRLLALLERREREPRNELERTLATIWSQVLDVGDVDRTSNYFHLGGDSIKSIQIVARARKAGIALTTGQVLAHPRLGALADAVERADHRVDQSPARGENAVAGDGFALTSTQVGILYQCEAQKARNLYVSRLAWTWHGPLDFDMLCMAWNQMLVNHDALRLHFGRDDAGRPMQWVAAVADCEIHFERSDDVEEASGRLLAAWRDALQDMSTAPLVRLGVIEVKANTYRIVLAHHHLILDGWSQALLLGRWLDAYAAFVDGGEARPHTALSFADALRHASASPPYDGSFWARHFAGYRAPAWIVVDLPGHAVAIDTVHRLVFTSEETARLAALGREAGATVATLVQLGWAIALGTLTRSTDVVFGLTLSGRDTAADLTDVVGMLINTLPIRLDLTGQATLGEWLLRHQAVLAEVIEHGHDSLSAVARSASLSGPYPFDSLLVVENIPLPMHASVGASFDAVDFSVSESWPVVLAVHPGAELAIELKCDSAVCGGAGAVETIRDTLRLAMASIGKGTPATPVAGLLHAVRPERSALRAATREPAGLVEGRLQP